MAESKRTLANARIQWVTYLGLWVNLGLTLFKMAVGWLTGSLALVADGVHSFSDFATDIILLLGIRWGSKEPDESHPFGHGRAETFVAALMGAGLLAVGGGMIYKASVTIMQMNATGDHSRYIGAGVIWAAILAVIAKEWLYRVTMRVAVETHSAMVYANAWEHRTDAVSSVAVLIGAASVRFWHYPHGDQVAAIVVGIMIILVAVQILGKCFQEFSERSADRQTVSQIEKIMNAQPEIAQWHKLRTRRVGREIFLDVHILVDPDLSITEAHTISRRLEQALHDEVTLPVNVIVHVEPDLPEERK